MFPQSNAAVPTGRRTHGSHVLVFPLTIVPDFFNTGSFRRPCCFRGAVVGSGARPTAGGLRRMGGDGGPLFQASRGGGGPYGAPLPAGRQPRPRRTPTRAAIGRIRVLPPDSAIQPRPRLIASRSTRCLPKFRGPPCRIARPVPRCAGNSPVAAVRLHFNLHGSPLPEQPAHPPAVPVACPQGRALVAIDGRHRAACRTLIPRGAQSLQVLHQHSLEFC